MSIMKMLLVGVLAYLVMACTNSGAAGDPAPSEEEARPSPSPAAEASPTATPASSEAPDHLSRHATGWATDWSKHTVPLDELVHGGPPRDGIPPIDQPEFIGVDAATDTLAPEEPVVVLAQGETARAYPLAILIWHEIVNDEVGGRPVTVTFCPLCNTAIAFDREVNGKRLDFGTSGLLRHSDLVMWDRQTESLWQQVTGEAIVGEMVGERLEFLPTSIQSFAAFREAHPDGQVLSSETGHRRAYGSNPYEGYDRSAQPFLFRGESDPRLPALARVVGLVMDDTAVAYPFEALAEVRVVNDEIDGRPVAVFYEPDTLSALDAGTIQASRAVGSAIPYDPVVDGQRLTFEWQEDGFVDRESGSRWEISGRAVEGPLAGTTLDTIPHANHFWFALHAFYPEVEIRPQTEE